MRPLLMLFFCSIHLLSGMELFQDRDVMMADAPSLEAPLNGLHCSGMAEVIRKGIVLHDCLERDLKWVGDTEGELLTKTVEFPQTHIFHLPQTVAPNLNALPKKNIPRIVRWNRQGTMLAIVDNEKTVSIYDQSWNEPVCVITPAPFNSPFGFSICDISWNPQGTHIACSLSESAIHIHDVTTGKQVKLLRQQDYVNRLAWHPTDDTCIAAIRFEDIGRPGGYYNILSIINSETNEMTFEKKLTHKWIINGGENHNFTHINWHPTQKNTLAIGCSAFFLVYDTQNDQQSAFHTYSSHMEKSWHPTDLDLMLENNVMWEYDGHSIISYKIKAYNPGVKGPYEEQPISSCWHPNGNRVTIGYHDGSVRTFDVSDLIALRAYLRKPQTSLSELFFLKHLARAIYKKDQREKKAEYEKDPGYCQRKRQRVKEPKEDLSAWFIDSLHFTVRADCPIDIDNPPAALTERDNWEHNLIKYVVEDKQQKNYFWRLWKMPPAVKKIAWKYMKLERAAQR